MEFMKNNVGTFFLVSSTPVSQILNKKKSFFSKTIPQQFGLQLTWKALIILQKKLYFKYQTITAQNKFNKRCYFGASNIFPNCFFKIDPNYYNFL